MPLKPLSIKPDHTNLGLVSELMQAETRQWNPTSIRQFFIPQEAETILRISISQLGAKDRLVWHFTPNVVYTVGSGYKLAYSIQRGRGGKTGHSRRISEKTGNGKPFGRYALKGKLKCSCRSVIIEPFQ